MQRGFVKIHRGILDWEWYEDDNTFRLFLHLILKANHKDKKWRGILVPRGSLITGRNALAKELSLTPSKIRTSLENLKKTGELTSKTTNRFSMITICKYDTYNDLDFKNRQPDTNRSPADRQQIATNKNEKNEKNIYYGEKKFRVPTTEELGQYFGERGSASPSVDAERFFDYYESKGWLVGKTKMKDWKAAVRNWIKNSQKWEKQNDSEFMDLGDAWKLAGGSDA